MMHHNKGWVRHRLSVSAWLPGEWCSGQCAPLGIPKVLGSNPVFSTTQVTFLLQLNEAKSSCLLSFSRRMGSWNFCSGSRILFFHRSTFVHEGRSTFSKNVEI
mmetsp:Transcript_52659/g.109889  ORF Transcript_52659/g.109889 Transcript_52659/m.109889 type:complete len:103 (+) Transcript_52659:482-790(+)